MKYVFRAKQGCIAVTQGCIRTVRSKRDKLRVLRKQGKLFDEEVDDKVIDKELKDLEGQLKVLYDLLHIVKYYKYKF